MWRQQIQHLLLSTLGAWLLVGCSTGSVPPTPEIVPSPASTSAMSPTPTAGPDSARLAISRALARAEKLRSYSVGAEVVALYTDGREKRLVSEMDLQFRDPGKQSETARMRPGSTGLESMFKTMNDPLMRSFVLNEAVTSPRALLNRQPGLWTLLNKAMEYLASATIIREIDTTEAWGPSSIHYRASFPHRPDLDMYKMGSWSINADLMLRAYDGAAVTVDVWIGKGDDLVQQIQIITRGISYPDRMPEPNDLLGVVEERATLTFSLFRFHDPDSPL